MRAFESLLWLVGSSWAAWWIIGRPARRVHAGLAGMAAVIALLHLVVEGARFHMVPTYGLLAVLIGLSARRSGAARNPGVKCSTEAWRRSANASGMRNAVIWLT